MYKTLIFLFIIVITSGCGENSKNYNRTYSKIQNQIQAISFKVVRTYPHDTGSFTEGFLFQDHDLFESTGSPEEYPAARSVFGIVDLKTGRIDVKNELNKTNYFGEGIVILNGKIYQLTYKGQVGFVYDLASYKKIGSFHYSNREGWGLTTDGENIIMSDGTNIITYLDPDSLKITRKLDVTFNGSPALYINELEYINGFIYANIWTTSNIAKIDPGTGKIVGIIDLSSLFVEARNQYAMSEAANGIAYDLSKDRIFVTGKLWPVIYEIKFVH